MAGNGGSGYSGDGGPATSAKVNPLRIAVDGAGNLYILDMGNDMGPPGHYIRKVASDGTITTVVGNALPFTALDLAVDGAANLYAADPANCLVSKISSAGVITTVAGDGAYNYSGDGGPAIQAQLSEANRVAVGDNSAVYIADPGNCRVRKVSQDGSITTFAGTGVCGSSGDNGPAANARLSAVSGLATDRSGNLYIADSAAHRVRKVGAGGAITTVYGDSSVTTGPDDVAADNSGNLYLSVFDILEMPPAGALSKLLAGRPFNEPAIPSSAYNGLAADGSGNVYVADSNYQTVQKISAGGTAAIVAGHSGIGWLGPPGGYSGDGGLATGAMLSHPEGLAVDGAGYLYIADTGNHAIRRVSPRGIITTVAGTGTAGYSGDGGPATSAQLNAPTGVAVDQAGNIYLADSGNRAVRLLQPAGKPLSVASASPLAPATVGAAYSQPLAASGGAPPYTWVLVSGALPSGLTLSAAGVLSGTPVAAGSATFTVRVTDSVFTDATQALSLTVAAALCVQSVYPSGQAWPAAGGTGAIQVTAAAGCSWTAATTLGWIAVAGSASGSGNGTVTYQVSANTGAARSGSVSVAGLSFTVEEAAASIAGITSGGSMAQLASAGYWTTAITLVNTGSSPAQARLSFFDDNGNPLALPLSFPQSSGGASPLVLLLASTLDRTLNPGAELVIQSTGPNSQATLVGWAQLLTNGAIGGFAVFSQAIGNANQEAEVPLETRNASGYVVPFDNTNGAATGIALANISAQAVNTAITIRDGTGTVILSDTLTLPAMGHTSFNLADRYASITAQRRGTLEFRTPSAGQISVLGLRFNATGAFSTIPALAK